MVIAFSPVFSHHTSVDGVAMSVADHFDQVPDAGFVRQYDASSARRQFNVSLMLILVITLAASAVGFLVRFDHPADQLSDVSSASAPYAGTLRH